MIPFPSIIGDSEKGNILISLLISFSTDGL